MKVGFPDGMRFNARIKLPSEFHQIHLHLKGIGNRLDNHRNVQIAVFFVRCFGVRPEKEDLFDVWDCPLQKGGIIH